MSLIAEPPTILDGSTSRDLIVSEGESVVLACKAAGHPSPQIRWRREDGHSIRGAPGTVGKVGQCREIFYPFLFGQNST